MSEVADRERFAEADERVAPELPPRLELQADRHNRESKVEVGAGFSLKGDARRATLDRRQMRVVLRKTFGKYRRDMPFPKECLELFERPSIPAHRPPIVLGPHEWDGPKRFKDGAKQTFE
jgi:hypothetical protein